MEIIDLAGLLVIAALMVAGGKYLAAQHGTNKAIRHIPAPALGAGDVPIADRLTHYYRLAQRSVRVLERLRGDYTVSPMLSEEDRRTIDQIVNDFYEEK